MLRAAPSSLLPCTITRLQAWLGSSPDVILGAFQQFSRQQSTSSAVVAVEERSANEPSTSGYDDAPKPPAPWSFRRRSPPSPRRVKAEEPEYEGAVELPKVESHTARFMSMEKRPQPRAPFQRPPIFFPNFTLQLMKLSGEQMDEVMRWGWTREVAFKTEPHVTKLEIKAFLESVYGLQVERVNTINYLGRLYTSTGRRGRPVTWRDKDWKKAYVTLQPPADLADEIHAEWLQKAEKTTDRRPVLDQILEAKGWVDGKRVVKKQQQQNKNKADSA